MPGRSKDRRLSRRSLSREDHEFAVEHIGPAAAKWPSPGIGFVNLDRSHLRMLIWLRLSSFRFQGIRGRGTIMPQTATIPPITRPPIAPKGTTFSKRTKSVSPPIHHRLITPPKKITPIRIQQHPRQKTPCCGEIECATFRARLYRLWRVRYLRGRDGVREQ